jgi:DNA polymerase-1
LYQLGLESPVDAVFRQNNLRDSLAQLPLSRQLTTIDCHVARHYRLDDLRRSPPDMAALQQQLGSLGFSSWLKTLNGDSAAPSAPSPLPAAPISRQYHTIDSTAVFDEWLARLQAAPLFAFDTETTSLNYSDARIVGLSFAIEAGQAAYIPLAHDYPEVPPQLDRDSVLAALKPLLEDPNKAKLGQNLKYDSHVLANHGITLQGIAHDSMLQSYVLNSTASRHNMDDLAKHYLQLNTTSFEAVAGKGAKQLGFAEVAIDTASAYACEDADITLRLHQCLSPQLQAIPALWRLYSDLEIPLIPVLTRMEANGVLIDSAMLAEQRVAGATDQPLALRDRRAHDASLFSAL